MTDRSSYGEARDVIVCGSGGSGDGSTTSSTRGILTALQTAMASHAPRPTRLHLCHIIIITGPVAGIVGQPIDGVGTSTELIWKELVCSALFGKRSV